ncbi:tRNA pseudouridine(13) synthase TruD [Poriferisphaera sp. WC338]|uniref:tRNA pseudouridine(13) synthase TruD n=1 Tax=Poriferisphaera sp. WC338 TaxID=3425129 RepID=UPI003D81B60B
MNHSFPQSPFKTTYLSADIPGTGGSIKQRHEDFLVEEQPLYQPTGEGEHLYLFIEKRGMTTLDVSRRIARAFHIKKSDVGYAGLKDKHAITRQHFSVYLPKRDFEEEGLKNLELHDNMTLLWHDRHANKLRRGHHGGNRFVIRIRDIQVHDVLRAKRVLDLLETKGVPNRIGDQRFGYRMNSHIMGYHLLKKNHQDLLDEMLGHTYPQDAPLLQEGREHYRKGDYQQALEIWPRALRYDRQALDELRQGKTAEQAVSRIDVAQRRLMISSTQSAAFNEVLTQRIKDNTFSTLLPGDLAIIHHNRAVFAVDDQTAEIENAPTGRIPSFEISPSGPMWGRDMPRTSGKIDQLEQQALANLDLSIHELESDRHDYAEGARRPLRIKMDNPDIEGGEDEHGPYIRLAFDLPRGAYATNILDEIMKPDQSS